MKSLDMQAFWAAFFIASWPAASSALTLESPTFHRGGAMPLSTVYDRSGCHGQNRSPALRFRDVPRGAKSFALTVHDIDAPAPGGWWHWVRFDIPASVRTLAPGAWGGAAGRDGRTSWGESAYGGPCPPTGPAHRYVFALLALDVPHLAAANAATTGPALAALVRGHVIGRTTLIGRYAQR